MCLTRWPILLLVKEPKILIKLNRLPKAYARNGKTWKYVHKWQLSITNSFLRKFKDVKSSAFKASIALSESSL